MVMPTALRVDLMRCSGGDFIDFREKFSSADISNLLTALNYLSASC